MPKIAEFFGISIYMYYRDHAPPHFHARYGGDDAEVSIDTLAVLAGRLRPRALTLVREWGELRRTELRAAWDRARAHDPPGRIPPLE